MVRSLLGVIAALSLDIPSTATAGPRSILQPVPVGPESVRFNQGVATLDLQLPGGAVQVTPLPMDHGSYAFGIAVWNDGAQPANIDITNFEVAAGAQHLAVFSREQLEKKAQNRAMWTQIALAAAGGLAAAAAASARDHYTSTFATPRGTYRWHYSAPSAAGQAAAAASIAGAGVGIYAVQQRLDATRAALGAETVQLTTVDPGDSYAGRIVLEKVKKPAMPMRVTFVVNWNGQTYPFAFQVVRPGTPQPVFPIVRAAAPLPAAIVPTVAPPPVAVPPPPQPVLTPAAIRR